MQVGAAAQRADLAIAEHAGDRHCGERLAAEAHIAVGRAVEAPAAAQAGEQQGGQGLGLPLRAGGKQQARFLAGGVAIAKLELLILEEQNSVVQ